MSAALSTSGIMRCRPALAIGAGLLIGYWVGATDDVPSRARAEVTEGPHREAFKDGGVLNEVVLREIAATLKRIETRVEHIEKRLSPAPPNAAQK